MAREYGRVNTQFWNSDDIRSLSDRGKLLANYLITGPHSNSIGAYLLPNAYVADDLGWSSETVLKVFQELFATGFAKRFKDGRHIVVVKFLAWNPIENPNVGKAALRQLEQLPDDPAIAHVINGLKKYEKQFPNGLETVLERFRNIEPFIEPEPVIEPEMDLARSAHADEAAQAIEAYNIIARELSWPEAVKITKGRLAKLRERLREVGGIPGWRDAMSKARASPFLRGESGRAKGHEKWAPDIDFFLQQSSFTKLLEGKYDDRDSKQEPNGFGAVIAGARAAAFG